MREQTCSGWCKLPADYTGITQGASGYGLAVDLALPAVLAIQAGAAFDLDGKPGEVADGVAAAAGEMNYVVDVPSVTGAGGFPGAGTWVQLAESAQDVGAAADAAVLVSVRGDGAISCLVERSGEKLPRQNRRGCD